MSQTTKSPYFINKKPKLPSLKEINQSKDEKLCCNDCVAFWDKVQSQESYYLQQLKEKQAEEKEFDILQKRLAKQHENDPISIMDTLHKKCRCGHEYQAHNKTVYADRSLGSVWGHSGCNTCGCDNYQKPYPFKYGSIFYQNKIRKGMLGLFDDPNYCIDSRGIATLDCNQHKFSAKYHPSGKINKEPQYCVYCRYYLADLKKDGLTHKEKPPKRPKQFVMYDWDSTFGKLFGTEVES